MFNWMQKKMNKKRKGFTLVELVVVIAILGLLVALAVPRLFGARENAAVNTHNANVRTIESAIALYQAQFNVEEPTMDQLAGEDMLNPANLYVPDGLKDDSGAEIGGTEYKIIDAEVEPGRVNPN